MKFNRQTTISIYLSIVVIVTFTIFNYITAAKNANIKFLNYMIENEAKVLFENIIITRLWNAEHGGVYVKQKNNMQPNPYLEDNTLLTKDNELLLKVNPAWMMRQISELSNQQSRHSFYIRSLKPKNPKNYPDAFEKEALIHLTKHPEEKYYTQISDDFEIFKFMGSLKVNPSCLQCHTTEGYKVGDVIGGVSVQVSLNDYKKEYNLIKVHYERLLVILIVMAIIIAIVGTWFIVIHFDKNDKLVKNLFHVKKLQNENETLVKRYKFALEGSQIGIWDWDIINDEIYFDENWKAMLGYTNYELRNEFFEWQIRLHPDDKEKAIQDIVDNQNHKTDFYINIHRLKHKNGNWIWILDQGKTYFDEQGNPARMIGSHTNITELKELELKILEKEQNLMHAHEIAQMGHWRYNPREDKFFISQTLKKLLGLELIEHSLGYTDLKTLVVEDDLDYFITTHKKALLGNEKVNLQYRIKRHGSDEIININEYISYITSNKSEDGIFIGTMQNITHLKNLENELILFKTIINNSPISIIITDIQAKIIYVNPHFCKVSGYTKEEAIGKNPNIIKSPSTELSVYEDLWKNITNKQTWGGIFRNTTKHGEEYWETALIIPILNNKNEISNYLGIKREITKEIFLKKELEEKEELMISQSKHAAMGEMISMIAHQWRQPITTISMIANNILADIELEMLNNDEAKKYALQIGTQTQYLSNTIEDFRNFFKQNKNVETSTLAKMFEDISLIIESSLKNNSIEMQTHYDEKIEITTYTRELIQVLINIIKNAKEALQESHVENKRITIKVEEIHHRIIFLISDNAGGIKDEIIGKIFDAYFTTKENQNGTGLGLYMSRMIVEKHLHGTLSVYNTKEGATFKIELPQTIS